MRNQLPPIGRRPDGSFPSMTPKQRKQANALIRETCCNYDKGNCIVLDEGDGYACVQSISYSLCCAWFYRAVLPLNKQLETDILKTNFPERFRNTYSKTCTRCGTSFTPGSNRAKYCKPCSVKVHRKQKNESERNRRNRRNSRTDMDI